MSDEDDERDVDAGMPRALPPGRFEGYRYVRMVPPHVAAQLQRERELAAAQLGPLFSREGLVCDCRTVDEHLLAQRERRLLTTAYDRRRCMDCHRLFPPEVRKPNIPEVLPLAQSIHARNPAWCCNHVVLADGNVHDDNVRFCIDWAEREGHLDCLQLAKLLLRMSKTQRRKLRRVVR